MRLRRIEIQRSQELMECDIKYSKQFWQAWENYYAALQRGVYFMLAAKRAAKNLAASRQQANPA